MWPGRWIPERLEPQGRRGPAIPSAGKNLAISAQTKCSSPIAKSCGRLAANTNLNKADMQDPIHRGHLLLPPRHLHSLPSLTALLPPGHHGPQGSSSSQAPSTKLASWAQPISWSSCWDGDGHMHRLVLAVGTSTKARSGWIQKKTRATQKATVCHLGI